MAGFTAPQQKLIAIIPKFSSFASACGSICIITEVLYRDRRKLGRVYHRTLLVMSVYDVIESSWNFASSWPIPRGTQGVAFAVGNQQTCTVQGFILQFGLAIPILNMCLSIYYLLVMRFSWSEERIRRQAEPWFHVVSLSVPLATCIASVFMKLFNNSNLWCWIAPLPAGCKDTYTFGPEEANCVRGDNAWIYRWAFYYAELWFCILFVMCAMAWLCTTVRRLENASKLYSSSYSNRPLAGSTRSLLSSTRRIEPQSKSNRVVSQALWYVGAFYFTFLFATINRLVQQVAKKTYFPLIVIHSFFEPGQGFFNYIVYIRPRYLRYNDRKEQGDIWEAMRYIFLLDEKRNREIRVSAYVGDDHEDEEEAKSELDQWRKLFSSATSRSKMLRSKNRSDNSSLHSNKKNGNEQEQTEEIGEEN